MGHYLLKKLSVLKCLLAGLFILSMAATVAAAEMKFDHVVIFGDSLSDSGNAFALTGNQCVPPYDTLDSLLIPPAPYAKGGHHFSNGPTWIEYFARHKGLAGNALPAFKGSSPKSSNYAVGGATARDDNQNYDLSFQVNTYLAKIEEAPDETLYVIEIGGNDILDALTAWMSNDQTGAYAIINDALAKIGDNIGTLHKAGARQFLVWNTPDLGLTPAILILDTETQSYGAIIGLVRLLEQTYNENLNNLLTSISALPGIEIRTFDFYQKINDVVADPRKYGLEVVNAACIKPNIPPYHCQRPDEYLFWDGIHPTTRAHALLADEVAKVLNATADSHQK